MCGLAGFISPRTQFSNDELNRIVVDMADMLQHRGPDDAGSWCDQHDGIALAHRRLSIIDLSKHGHQPMISTTGRYILSYNGEIYNFQEIKKQLLAEGAWFSGDSDTEVLLEAIEYWGIESSLKKLVGMFAFAVWDKTDKVLYLARDRIGEKPLYYGWHHSSFLFASEIKALKKFPLWKPEIDRHALSLYMRYSYIPAPCSIYKKLKKLRPGTFLKIPLARMQDESVIPVEYWSATDVIQAGINAPFTGSEEEAISSLHHLFRTTIENKLISDVPLGAFLSGGIDSSLIVSLMQEQSQIPVRTFTIGFDEKGFDEAQDAKAVARHLGTEHTELYVKPREAMDVISELPHIYCEPFADSSQIPTWLVSRLAKQYVTVSLSGDGGDELFCGYNRYYWARSIHQKTARLPAGLRMGISHSIQRVPPEMLDRLFGFLSKGIPGRYRYHQAGDKLHKIAKVLSAKDKSEVYQQLISQTLYPEQLVIGLTESACAMPMPEMESMHEHFEHYMMHLDLLGYLPGDILTKLDRASMAVSLEARVPFLDHRIIEYAWKLPLSVKLKGRQGKWILRQILNRYIPQSMIDRPKRGFGIPLAQWLKGPLKEWAEQLLSASRLEQEGYLNIACASRLWDEHQSGKHDHSAILWNILMFQSWLDDN